MGVCTFLRKGWCIGCYWFAAGGEGGSVQSIMLAPDGLLGAADPR